MTTKLWKSTAELALDLQQAFDAGVKSERQRINQELAQIKRWVATIQGKDEYIIKDQDIKKLEEKI